MTHLDSAATGYPLRPFCPSPQDVNAPMSPATYRQIIADFGMSQIEAGRFMGVSDNSARKMGVEGPSPPVEKLLKLMLAMDLRPEDVNSAIRRWEREAGA